MNESVDRQSDGNIGDFIDIDSFVIDSFVRFRNQAQLLPTLISVQNTEDTIAGPRVQTFPT